MTVAHSLHVLLDNRPLIQIFRHVVAGGTDQLYALVVGLLIRVRPHEGRQERVMNIDHSMRVMGDKIRTEDLHVTGQHHHIHLAVEFGQGLGFRLGLIVCIDRNMMVLDAEALHFIAQIIMITDHHGNGGRQIAPGGTPEQIHQHMIVP